jgi:hypothetical protein
MLILSLIGQFSCLLGALLLSGRRIVRAEGSFEAIFEGAFLLYVLTLASSFLFSVVIPSLLIASGVDKHTVYSSFPESICNVPVFLFGWGPAAVFAVLVRGISNTIKKTRTSSSAES